MFFLELSCFFNDPTDVGNLISGFSAFSKTILNIWKFTVHELLKPGLENFEHYFTSVCTLIILNFTLEIRAAILYFITQGNRHLPFINIIITINNQIMQTEDKLQTHWVSSKPVFSMVYLAPCTMSHNAIILLSCLLELLDNSMMQ